MPRSRKSDLIVQPGKKLPPLPVRRQGAGDVQLITAQFDFDGQWLPDMDPIHVGPGNYTIQENLRPGPKYLEGVQGYTKITTNAVDETYKYIRSGFQLRTEHTVTSYVLVQAENAAGTASRVFQNQTAVPSAGDFETDAIHVDAAGAGRGRFSEAPGGNLVYANGVESCVWAGDEMNCGAFFTLWQPTTTRTDIALNDNGADPDSIVTVGGDFASYGFEAGQTATLTVPDYPAYDGDYDISGMSLDGKTIYIPTGSFSGTLAPGSSVTVTAAGDTEYGNPVDWTLAANNSQATVENIIPIGGGLDSNCVLYLPFDGTQGSTTIVDLSSGGADSPHTSAITVHGAYIDTADSKFGTGALILDGVDDYIEIADSADWYHASNAFTIEFWIKGELVDGDSGFFQQYLGVNDYVQAYVYNESFIFRVYDTGGYNLNLTGGANPFTSGSWTLISLVRGWGGDVSTVAYCINRKMVATAEFTDTNGSSAWPDLAAPLEIGRATTGSGTKYFSGRLDGFYMVKGKALFTSDSVPPIRPPTETQRRFMIYSTRPLTAIKPYVAEANTEAGAELAGWIWTGREFTAATLSDGTEAGGISIAQTGEVALTTGGTYRYPEGYGEDQEESVTAGDARPFFFEGLFLYAYLFELSAGSALLTRTTVKSDFQAIGDVWDGVKRQPIVCQLFKADGEGGGSYEDYTIPVNRSSDMGYPMGAIIDGMTSDDHLLIAFDERMAVINIAMLGDLVNSEDAVITLEYWNGGEYVKATLLSDSTHPTINLKSFSQTGDLPLYPPPPHEEAMRTQFGVTAYYYRITVDNPLSVLGNGQYVTIETITGIPAQQTVRPFRFPSLYKNRVMLCGFVAGKEGNRVDYGPPNTTDVWNGYESSMDGLQSLYFGGSAPLVAAGQLFNRYGSSIYTLWLAIKQGETYLLNGNGPEDYRIYPITLTMGIAAPQTLDFAEMGYELATDVMRNIAIWMSFSGPVIFDGAILSRLEGINKFFDVADPDCIKWSIIDRSVGWYDAAEVEYNLGLPCGAAATGVTRWFCFSWRYRKFYEKKPPVYPQCGFRVMDTNGVQYVYSGVDTGHVLRLEYGDTWDGEDILQRVALGDFLLGGSIWQQTRLRYLKVIAQTLSEAAVLRALHYADTAETATSLTRSDISFTEPDTIATVGGDFRATGFRPGQTILPDGAGVNDLAFDIDAIAAGGTSMTLSGNTVTTAAAGASITVAKIADMSLTLNSGSNRVSRATAAANLLAWAHRLEFSTSTNSSTKGMRLLGWGALYHEEREDLGSG